MGSRRADALSYGFYWTGQFTLHLLLRLRINCSTPTSSPLSSKRYKRILVRTMCCRRPRARLMYI